MQGPTLLPRITVRDRAYDEGCWKLEITKISSEVFRICIDGTAYSYGMPGLLQVVETYCNSLVRHARGNDWLLVETTLGLPTRDTRGRDLHGTLQPALQLMACVREIRAAGVINPEYIAL